MPEYNPAIHDVIEINFYETRFVKAYIDIDSATFGNAYQSAIQAGYSPSYARVIGHYYPKWRIKKALENMNNPLAQSLISDESDGEYTPSKRELKRLRTEENRRFNEVKTEFELLFGKPE